MVDRLLVCLCIVIGNVACQSNSRETVARARRRAVGRASRGCPSRRRCRSARSRRPRPRRRASRFSSPTVRRSSRCSSRPGGKHPEDGNVAITAHFHGAVWFAIDEHLRRGLDEPLALLRARRRLERLRPAVQGPRGVRAHHPDHRGGTGQAQRIRRARHAHRHLQLLGRLRRGARDRAGAGVREADSTDRAGRLALRRLGPGHDAARRHVAPGRGEHRAVAAVRRSGRARRRRQDVRPHALAGAHELREHRGVREGADRAWSARDRTRRARRTARARSTPTSRCSTAPTRATSTSGATAASTGPPT